MASSRSQAAKGSEKRKRDRADLDESSLKKKRRSTKADKAKATEEAADGKDADSPLGDSSPGNRVGTKSRANGDIFETKTSQRWRISEPMGGRMSDVEPIFTADEKYASIPRWVLHDIQLTIIIGSCLSHTTLLYKYTLLPTLSSFAALRCLW